MICALILLLHINNIFQSSRHRQILVKRLDCVNLSELNLSYRLIFSYRQKFFALQQGMKMLTIIF